MSAYRDLLENELLNLPGVKESTSIAVMEVIKESQEIDIWTFTKSQAVDWLKLVGIGKS